MIVEDIKRTTVKVPYREIPQRAMDRELPHWRYTEIVEVRLKSGHVGFGETLLYYTWGVTGDDDVQARGMARTPPSSCGTTRSERWFADGVVRCGCQGGRCAGAPVVGPKQVHQTHAVVVVEHRHARRRHGFGVQDGVRAGLHRSYKTKGRPWFDVWEQVEKSAAVVPESFKIDMDFNDTLLDAERGIPILKDLEKYPQVDIYESPIPQGDVEGNRKICEATRVNIAMHYGNPAPKVAISSGCCDGFVVGGGASRLMQQGHVCAMADMPFWLQLVGTGLTAAFSLHFGGVLSHARWPAVNCHQLYTHTLLSEAIEVRDGQADVPDVPGLGYEPDPDIVARFRVEKPASRPEPPRMVETRWPDGRRMYFANNDKVNFMLTAGMQGKIPYYERGVTSALRPNDGSQRWRDLYERARKAPFITNG